MANVNNITSSNPGRNGVMFRGPIGAELPTDALSELDEQFIDQGIVGEDGVSQAITRDTEDVKAYGGDIVYTLQTDFGEEFTVVLYESRNVETLKTVFGEDNVTEDSAGNITVRHNKSKLPRCSFVFDHEIDQGVKRQVMAIGQVVSVGDIVNVHSDIVKYELTVKAFPDAAGNVLTEYIAADDGSNSLQIGTSVVKAAKVGEKYNVQLQAAGGKQPYKWEAIGALPAGLTLAADGTISGTPTAEGEKSITVKVTDSADASAQKTLQLTVGAA
ncbi:Ig domain-containing protein [Corynebacterium amycolatum]|uniref:Ig domain-containing protein n=1 Tax=Corynebacterium amycolatum TaxID=43765 RepID=UPI001CCBAEF9|nr:Ig domain-containing protein [Corynebacterium amycolatum]MCA0444374.1 Ig domain-containing protein [Corynebacterium amycolatum]MDC7116159.1 Ig domain-containing protein [Corynebacterium amycolatum]